LRKRDSVLGHPVAVDRWTTVDGSQSTDWRAPDLGCVSFQYVLEKRQPDGSYKLSTKEKPVSLQLGEPDQRLFEIGAEYAEVHPSEAFGKVLALLGKTPRPETAERDKNQDQLYDRLWAAHPGWTPSE